MRLVNGKVNVYYTHDTLAPGYVRAASYGTDDTTGALVPEVGDVLRDFPGWNDADSVTVRVVEVTKIGVRVEAYEVRTSTVPANGGSSTSGPEA